MQTFVKLAPLAAELTMAVVLFVGSPASDKYTAAYHQAASGRAVLVTVYSASWCEPCQRLRAELEQDIPGAAVVFFDVDEDAAAIASHRRGRMVPEIRLSIKKDGRWHSCKMTGFRMREQIINAVDRMRGQ